MRIGALSRVIASAATLAVLSSLGWVALAAPAQADTAPATGTPATVSADALPTWQVNGVVWSQDTVGNNVWAGGSFTKARPAGVAVGGAGEVSADNLFVYDVTTGNRVSSISHSLNGQVLTVKKSPDGSRVYVGGDFTTVDGQTRNHIAAFDASSGALVAGFKPSIDAQVSAIAVSSTTVYAGGSFSRAAGTDRTRLAAFSPSTGAATSWAPTADAKVAAMVMSPDGSRVIVGGSFGTLSGTTARGMGAIDPSSGATLAWAANTTITNSGSEKCGITSLRTDGSQVYGAGFAYGCGNFEGTFAADPNTGAINWVNDCQGDTYDVLPVGQVLYTATHAHNCSMIGAFPESPVRATNMRRALAYTTYPTGTNKGPDVYQWNYNGVPDSTMLQWFPTLAAGTYTGQSQAAWSVTGNSSYVAMGGEFPSVNGTAQQGLVRFAVRSIAPNKRAPVRSGTSAAPTANSLAAGTVRVAWAAAYDMDNAKLTYDVYRSGTTAPVYTTTLDSTFWNYPAMGFIDRGVTPGATYTYTIKATDALGNVATFPKTGSVTVGTAAASAYSNDVLNDGATDYWRLGEASGTAVLDYSGFNDATAGTGVTRGASGAISGDANGATTFDGTGTGVVTQDSTQAATRDLTVEAWVKTTSTSGGKVVGYGNSNSTTGGTSNGYDRHIYMDNAGHLIFGIYDGNTRVVISTGTYNDGAYHQVAGTLSATKGMMLYVDGKRVGTNSSATVAQDYLGYWRIGGDSLGGWPNQPSSNSLSGTIDDVSIYPSVLTRAQVQQHYVDSGRASTLPATPTDSYGKAVYASDPDFFWRLGESGGTTAKDTSPNGTDGTYFGNPSFGQAGGVTGTSDTAVGFNGNGTGVSTPTAIYNPLTYTEELWFKTTTTNGGKLMGFGSSSSGGSDHYDRHIWMGTDGKLNYGVYTGQLVIISTPTSYNDGQWHQVAATLGSGGMALYVDGKSIGTNPNTAAEAYGGYWRVGGDNTWGTQPWFAGTIDEVAVYPTVLSSADVATHYAAGTPPPANQAPTASFSSSHTNLTAALDASTSFDADGSIASYSWDFGDSSAAGSGVSPNHAYASAGTYPVRLTVTDDKGATGTVTQDVTVTAPVNQAPTAAFSSSHTNLTASLDASTSFDADGSIASYSWDFGDSSAAGSGVSPNHAYASAGTYPVRLTVTDDKGATGTVTQDVTVTAPVNRAPTAAFSSSSADLVASFDGSGSSDSDGTVASYAWDFGDGGSASTARPSHTFGSAGTYSVKLTVSDDQGATDSVTKSVTVTAARVNQAPTAAFSSSSADLVASFDGSGSSDADGTVASYAWDFGDGGSASTARPGHTFGSAGTYSVRLTVTDDQGATGSVTRSVTVTAPPAGPVLRASDDFGRSVTGAWGSSEQGGAWTIAAARSSFGVAGGVGTMSMPSTATGRTATLGEVSVRNTDVSVAVSPDKIGTGGGTYVAAFARQSSSGSYRAQAILKADGTVSIGLIRADGTGAQTTLVAARTVSGLTYTAGTVLNLRLQAVGSSPTTVQARVWRAGTTEPTTWQVSATDSTSGLQTAGAVALYGYLSGSSTNAPVVLSWDAVRVSDLP